MQVEESAYFNVMHLIPVSLSSERYQICPSLEVVKWSSDHIMLKLSSKDPLDTAASDEWKWATTIAASKIMMDTEEQVLESILSGKNMESLKGGFVSELDLRNREGALHSMTVTFKMVLALPVVTSYADVLLCLDLCRDFFVCLIILHVPIPNCTNLPFLNSKLPIVCVQDIYTHKDYKELVSIYIYIYIYIYI